VVYHRFLDLEPGTVCDGEWNPSLCPVALERCCQACGFLPAGNLTTVCRWRISSGSGAPPCAFPPHFRADPGRPFDSRRKGMSPALRMSCTSSRTTSGPGMRPRRRFNVDWIRRRTRWNAGARWTRVRRTAAAISHSRGVASPPAAIVPGQVLPLMVRSLLPWDKRSERYHKKSRDFRSEIQRPHSSLGLLLQGTQAPGGGRSPSLHSSIHGWRHPVKSNRS
jgi:hypothetical protein